MSVRNQEPNKLWNHFADLNAVPRPSKKEERVIEFMMDFGKSLNLETIKDSAGNVIIFISEEDVPNLVEITPKIRIDNEIVNCDGKAQKIDVEECP